MIQLDSDIVIDSLRGRGGAAPLVHRLTLTDAIAVSVVTVGEVMQGAMYSHHPASAQAQFAEWRKLVTVLAVTEEIAHVFGRIRGELRQRGTPLADMDLLIAATALHHGLPLLTRNLRHFERVPGLTLYPTDGATSG